MPLFFGLVGSYVLLFIVGTTLFPVKRGPPPDPSQAGAALLGMMACGIVDTALLGLRAARTRLLVPRGSTRCRRLWGQDVHEPARGTMVPW